MDPESSFLPLAGSEERTANVWDFFVKQPRQLKGRSEYLCPRCDNEPTPFIVSSTTNARNHLKSKHPKAFARLQPPLNTPSSLPSRSSEIPQTPISQQPAITNFFNTGAASKTIRAGFNRDQYIESLIAMICRRRLAFSAVEWPEMKAFALSLNPAVEDQLVVSRRTLMRYMEANQDVYRVILKSNLKSAMSKIHISADLWTSPHRHAMLAVCAHWVDANYNLQTALLGLPECPNDHSGQAMAELIHDQLEEYEIEDSFGYFIGDNASSNNTCLEHLAVLLSGKNEVVSSHALIQPLQIISINHD